MGWWPWYAVVPLWLIAIGVLGISSQFRKFVEKFDKEVFDKAVDAKIESWANE